jgi:hypothetical protein
MKDLPHPQSAQSADAHDPHCTQDQLLSRLEDSLSRQLLSAKGEDFEAVFAAAGQIRKLLAEASEIPQPLSAKQAERLSRILHLHHQVGLVLAQKRDAVARKLLHSGRGRKALGAYRRGPA